VPTVGIGAASTRRRELHSVECDQSARDVQPDTYDPRRIDAELGMARNLGLNTLRVFLHDLLWVQDRHGFLRRLIQFVTIAASHGIKPLFVFFDSCWDPHPSLVLSTRRCRRAQLRWVQSPGASVSATRATAAF